MIINKNTILYRTNQAWKYKFIVMGAIAAAIPMIILGFNLSALEWLRTLCLIAIGAYSVIGFIFGYTIKCPACKSRWWWESLKHPLGGKKSVQYLYQESCPSCGFINDTST